MIYVWLAIFLCITFVHVLGCDRKRCDRKIPNHYSELRCTPIMHKDDCCPVRFECPKFENDGKCYVNGRPYNISDHLAEDDGPLCSTACYCSKSIDGMKFRCAHIECPEIFNGPKPECIYQSQFDRCCGKYECNKKKIAVLSKTRCWLDNKEYVKGEKMFSDKSGCYACICTEHFDNKTMVENPNCQKVKCNIEVHSSDRLTAGCIPIYYGKATCCPIDWRCPEPKDEVIIKTRSNHTNDDPNMFCKFGTLVLAVGDKLKSEKWCVHCSCSIPPMVHCVQDGHC